MSYVVGKMINGSGPYYYLVKSVRVNGQSKTIHIAYLGKNSKQKSGSATAETLKIAESSGVSNTPKQKVDLTGLADREGTQPSNVSQSQLTAGIKVEMEHTKDNKVAEQIAMDHLTEDKKYYTHLADMEKKYQKKKS